MATRLFHFSDDGSITRFTPRPVRVPVARPQGMEWLNDPLIWAIDEWHQPMYLFPRDCPRILVWRTPRTTPEDVERYFGTSEARMLAYVEAGWLERLRGTAIHRYELPPASFRSLDDAGMWVSGSSVEPLSSSVIDDLPLALERTGAEVRVLDDLTPLREVWQSSLHASGIRLRNARAWNG